MCLKNYNGFSYQKCHCSLKKYLQNGDTVVGTCFMGLLSRTHIKLNGKFYKTTIRSTMFYGTKYWVIKNQIEKVEYKER